jgi:large subunit ribosomal protein L13Ae
MLFPGMITLGCIILHLLTIFRLEERRKEKAKAWHERRKVAQKQLAEAKSSAKTDSKTSKQLAEYGY